VYADCLISSIIERGVLPHFFLSSNVDCVCDYGVFFWHGAVALYMKVADGHYDVTLRDFCVANGWLRDHILSYFCSVHTLITKLLSITARDYLRSQRYIHEDNIKVNLTVLGY
jgi:hypothetical protein